MSDSNHDFIINSRQESATKSIQQHQSMQLTSKDSEALVDDILNPPDPNKNLKVAAAEYQKAIIDK